MKYFKIFNKGTDGEYKLFYIDKERTIIHADDGPAAIWKDGHKQWWVNGMLHREDGPAMEWGDGVCLYFLNGVRLPKNEYWSKVRFGEFV